jgi:hypothetical protein
VLHIFLAYSYAVAGFSGKTLLKTPSGYCTFASVSNGASVESDNNRAHAISTVTHIYTTTERHCVALVLEDDTAPIICSYDQKFYCPTIQTWKSAKNLHSGDFLINSNGSYKKIKSVTTLKTPTKLFDISVSPHHTFFVSEHDILAHNILPIAVGFSLAFGGGAIEWLGVYGGIAILGSLFGFAINKNKKEKATIKFFGDCGGSPDPDDPNNFNKKKNTHTSETSTKDPNGRYEDAPYHTKNGNGRKSARPKDGQKALDNSLLYNNRVPHRIGISAGEFVVLYQTSEDLYHGHIRKWKDLEPDMQKVLRKAGLVTSKGKIIT